MAYLNDEIRSIQEFIKITAAGIDIADFTQIRASIIERYKSVYGRDIDVSTNNADGIFVNDLALIINNILQSMKTMYANLDVNTATGVYLDSLCRLSNVVRKSATNSIARITLTNIGSSSIQVNKSSQSDGMTFVDQAGEEWYYFGQSFTLEPTKSINIDVQAAQAGPIKAPIGWINQAVGEQLISVEQSSSALVGLTAETDSQLRARRAQSIGLAGSTVLESLAGELLSINVIRDVKIYNNYQNTNSGPETAVNTKDNSVLAPHSIYVIIRRDDIALDGQELSGLSSSTIGNIIYQKLTPGISTSDGGETVTNGVIKEFTTTPKSILEFSQKIYWKEAEPISDDIDIDIVAYDTYDETSMNNKVLSYIINYINGLQISQDLIANELIAEVLNADPTANARSTYYLSALSFSDRIVNPDTYFKYDIDSSFITQTGMSGQYRTFRISLRG